MIRAQIPPPVKEVERRDATEKPITGARQAILHVHVYKRLEGHTVTQGVCVSLAFLEVKMI